jgi:hypothetical protein
MDQSAVAPTLEFTLFPQLLSELRVKIWKHSLNNITPRLIEIHPDVKEGGYYSPARIPAILHTCYESRQEALKVYKLSFGTEKIPPRIFFCAADTLFLSHFCFTVRRFHSFMKETTGFDAVQSLAACMIISAYLMTRSGEDAESLWLKLFSDLREMICTDHIPRYASCRNRTVRILNFVPPEGDAVFAALFLSKTGMILNQGLIEAVTDRETRSTRYIRYAVNPGTKLILIVATE